MRVITQQTVGGPEVLTIVEAPPPRPLPTEVVVRVKAIGLNPLEALIRAGEFPLIGRPPFTLGWDISGVVESALTWRFEPGDEVFGMPHFPRVANAYAEVVTAPALHFVRKPVGMSHTEAAALPTVGLTAWQGLVDLGKVEEGDRVLIHGGGGGVGHVAIQIAKSFGAHVTATASPSKREFVESLGADEIIDYTKTDLVDVVSGIDLVFDTLGGKAVDQSLEVLRAGGHLVTAVAMRDAERAARFEAAGMRFSGIGVDPDRVALGHLVDLVDNGKLKVHIQEAFPFERVVDAHRLLDHGHLQGKVVLTV